MNRAAQVTYFLLRVVSGLLIFLGGAMKSFGWLGGMPPEGGTAPLMSQIGIGGWIEVIGGLLVILGLLTRPAAFILSGMMAVAYWQFHFWPNGGWPTQNGGVPAVLMCFIFLYIAAQGGGEWSLDALLRRKRGAPVDAAAPGA